jgi:hypothetical protein
VKERRGRRGERRESVFCLIKFIQTILDLAHNKIVSLPNGILQQLPHLKQLDVEFNILEEIPTDLVSLKVLKVNGNPLSTILPAYRNNSRVFFLFFLCVYELSSQLFLDFILPWYC